MKVQQVLRDDDTHTHRRDLVSIHPAEPNPPISSPPLHCSQWKINLWLSGPQATSETTQTSPNSTSLQRQNLVFLEVTPLNLTNQ